MMYVKRHGQARKQFRIRARSDFELGAMYIKGCQIDMQGPQLFAKPHHFCKLDVATSRMAFLDLNLHVLQVATSNSNN